MGFLALTTLIGYHGLFYYNLGKMGRKFKAGQNGVYPAHGVVEVMGIEEKEILGSKKSFYILNVLENNVTLMVPTDNISSVGLRPVVAKKEVKNILDILREKNGESPKLGAQSWNKRYKEYADKVKSGDIYEIARVLKDIHHLKKVKNLSFGEKRIMENAVSHIVKELSIAMGKKEESVSTQIQEILS